MPHIIADTAQAIGALFALVAVWWVLSIMKREAHKNHDAD